jgi:hypothetical protein
LLFCSNGFSEDHSGEWWKTDQEMTWYLEHGYELKFVNAFSEMKSDYTVNPETIIYTLMKGKQIVSCWQTGGTGWNLFDRCYRKK